MQKLYRVQDLQARLNRNISEEEADQIHELLREKAQEVGEALSEPQTRELDALFIMVQEKYALGSSDIEKLLSNIGTTEDKDINKRRLKWIYTGITFAALCFGAYHLRNIVRLNEDLKPTSSYIIKNEVIEEKVFTSGLLDKNEKRLQYNHKSMFIETYEKLSITTDLDDPIENFTKNGF